MSLKFDIFQTTTMVLICIFAILAPLYKNMDSILFLVVNVSRSMRAYMKNCYFINF